MAKNSTTAVNPANQYGALNHDRVSMSTPQQKLAVPEIFGYHCHWFKGDPGRIQRALRAGYEFVSPSETDLNNFDIAGDLDVTGQSDLGDRVSVPAQDGAGPTGQYVRLYLMKIKQEYYEQDKEQYEDRMIDPIVTALAGGKVGVGEGGERAGDAALRYHKPFKLPKMFTKKR